MKFDIRTVWFAKAVASLPHSKFAIIREWAMALFPDFFHSESWFDEYFTTVVDRLRH